VSKLSNPSPTESPLLFEVDPEPLPEILTALGGVPLVVQAFRSLGLPALVKKHVRIKERQRGYDEATLVESFVILNAVGGECLDDFVRLREDAGLSEMVGHPMPSPSVARKFLYEFHEEAKIEDAKRQRKAEQIAYIPEQPKRCRDWGWSIADWCGSWGGAVRISESPPWIRMRPSSRAGSRKPCEPTRESGGISQ